MNTVPFWTKLGDLVFCRVESASKARKMKKNNGLEEKKNSKVANMNFNIAGKKLIRLPPRLERQSYKFLPAIFFEVFEGIRTLGDGNVSIEVSPVQVLGHHDLQWTRRISQIFEALRQQQQ